jgi:hypothetical protein
MNKIKIIQTCYRFAAAIFIGMLIVACGSGGGSGDKTGLSNSYSITGAVSGVQASVSISLSGGAIAAVSSVAASGSFSFNNLSIGSYTVAPSLTGYTFNPDSIPVTIPDNNTSNIIFTAKLNTVPAYTLSGTVTGVVRQYVLITLSGSSITTKTTQSDINGYYSFTGLAAASYTVTPSKTGYAFSPAPPTVVISTANITGMDFIATTSSIATAKLNDTGVAASQCYQASSDVLVACNTAGATALNAAQDGMVGRDVTANNGIDGMLGFSFTKVCNSGQLAGTGACPVAAVLGSAANDWGCTQDNVTGLMWEVKTADGGLRDSAKTYTNYDSTTILQKLSGTVRVAPTQAEIDAASNSVGFMNSVNAQGLCGYKDWHLPTADELKSIVDYGAPNTDPNVDASWFPNTQRQFYWTSSPLADYTVDAWYLNFGYGNLSYGDRSSTYVRLVRIVQ